MQSIAGTRSARWGKVAEKDPVEEDRATTPQQVNNVKVATRSATLRRTVLSRREAQEEMQQDERKAHRDRLGVAQLKVQEEPGRAGGEQDRGAEDKSTRPRRTPRRRRRSTGRSC